MTEILASQLINVLLRKGFEKVEGRGDRLRPRGHPLRGAQRRRLGTEKSVPQCCGLWCRAAAQMVRQGGKSSGTSGSPASDACQTV
jgi:hypothetical protein